jgi:3-carboxy-cis,cis-muconate cycloisomerase
MNEAMVSTSFEVGRLTDGIRGTAPMRALWSAHSTLQAMLDVEAALARSCAAHGIMPAELAESIVMACRADRLDMASLQADAAMGGNAAIPMVKQLTALVRRSSPEAAGYVHWGATSQDIIDTGMVLQLRRSLAMLREALDQLCKALAGQAHRYRDTPMVGRSLLQQALPITLGLKLAQSLDALMRHRERLAQLQPRVEVLQFGGAVGTLASLGSNGPGIVHSLAKELDLGIPDVPWHTHRDRIAEIAAWLGILMGTLGKMAEPWMPGRGGSSTMPHKRNPSGCAAVLTAALRAPHLVSSILSGMPQEHERSLGGWQAEWDVMPELVVLASGALENMTVIVSGLQVNQSCMSANLAKTNGLILSEAIMLALGRKMGRHKAHDLVEDIARKAAATGQPFCDLVNADERVGRYLNKTELCDLLNPQAYLGQAGACVDAVLARVNL